MPEAPIPPDIFTIQKPEVPRKPVGITVTHHLPDYKAPDPTMSLEDDNGFLKMLEKRKREGVDTQRFDIRWRDTVTKQGGAPDAEYLKRCVKVAETGIRAGLENNIVLSSAPKWALELAKKDPAAFRAEYTTYIDSVFRSLAEGGVKPPAEFQIFNELNMKNYTPDALLPQLADCVTIVKAKSREHFGREVPVSATLQVSTFLSLKAIPRVVEGAENFVRKRDNILRLFDRIKLDYYPGVWHSPIKTLALYWKHRDYIFRAFRARNDDAKVASLVADAPMDMFRKAFGNMELLEKVLTQMKPLQDKGVDIGIGEIGMPSIVPFETDPMRNEHQKLQTLALKIVGWKLRPLMDKFHLTEVGIYSEMDEPTPELGAFDWGLRDKTGKPKHAEGYLADLITRIRAPYEPIQKPLSEAS